MSIKYKSDSLISVGTEPTIITTLPPSVISAICAGINVANVANMLIYVTVIIFRVSNQSTINIVKKCPVEMGTNIDVIKGKLILLPGDIILVNSSLETSADFVISYIVDLEQILL